MEKIMKIKPRIESIAKYLSWLEVGNIYYNLGNNLEAVKMYEKAINEKKIQ
jgi:tetratricopeptide (TPR) repeat protein